ncbi:50S ribosomal protein L44e [Candidatus Micrarchaeota archaeon]|nr:50S ribosomal protein L44e [Candidatus Micrarchaeota archaeon]
MKFPKEVRAYCPYCNAHKKHKVKVASKGSARTLAIGNRAHQRSLMGHGGKRAGEKTVKKQGKRQKLMLECTECKKKTEKVVGSRTVKKIELKG